MAASIKRRLCHFVRLSSYVLKPPRNYLRLHTGRRNLAPFSPPNNGFHGSAPVQGGGAADGLPGFKDRPWDYLSSEGTTLSGTEPSPCGRDYRRNHKGAIPPQKTRKTCTRGDKICGNPCPICRDRNIVVHHQNVKLLQQFISPHTGLVLDPTRTGVCMKQQKKLLEAIVTAQNHGLLLVHVPFVDFSEEDYSSSHDAVGLTAAPQPPTSSWYRWYAPGAPDEEEVAGVRKKYQAYLKSPGGG
ncbi:unnamed protein product, partial [Tetraodon nigroviridis]